MCAIYSLMCSDLLPHDQILAITQQHLQELSQEISGPVANKATKVIPGSAIPTLLDPSTQRQPNRAPPDFVIVEVLP